MIGERVQDLWIHRSGTASFLLVAALALLVGFISTRFPQLAMTFVLLVLLLGARGRSRAAGVMTLWAYWLLIPGLRRVLDLVAPGSGPDPLSLLPFLGTGMLAFLELREIQLNRRAKAILLAAGASILIGLPVGFLKSPIAGCFAALAFGTALSAFVIGWADGVRGDATLERVLRGLLPLLALYAITQFLLPLTSWDKLWVENSELLSIAAPGEAGHIRVFSTLNSYFTLALVLAVGLILGLSYKRRIGRAVPIFVILTVALAFTFDRSVWLGLVIALFVFVAVGRKSGSGRVVATLLVGLTVLVVAAGSNPTTAALTERFTSLGSPGKDVSAQARLETTERLVPESLHQPLGSGLGQAGLSSELSGPAPDPTLVNIDDGYLSSLYQSGPIGLLLLVLAIGLSMKSAASASTNAKGRDQSKRSALFATLVMLVIVLASAEVLFGATGAIFWYLCGTAVALAAGEASAAGRAPGRTRTIVAPAPSPV